ncbi:MAG: ABC transporter permease [Propionibacteriaceae bacterium]|nr:ABC transporter permease [Propionibacteriaceae bacterium]
MTNPMWSVALRELRYHRGRYIATLLAIAISVGFMAAASIVTATEGSALGKQLSAKFTEADIIVTVQNAPEDLTVKDVTAAIKSTPGISSTQVLEDTMSVVETSVKAQVVTAVELPLPGFRWASLLYGQWPEEPNQVAISRQTADALKVGTGDEVTALGTPGWLVVGITAEGRNRLSGDNMYVAAGTFARQDASPMGFDWLVASADDVHVTQRALRAALAELDVAASVRTSHVAIDDAVKDAMKDVNAFKYILWAFAGIALVVGAITVSNTFTILLTQRRRQIGLLRCVGATGSQVQRSVLGEAFVVGLLGSLFGVGLAAALAAIVGLVTGSIAWGISLPLRDVTIAVALGLIITVLACAAPSRQATKVPVLQAMQSADVSVSTSRLSLVRIIACSVLTLAGATLCALSIKNPGSSFMMAIMGAALVSLGVLFGARIFVPPLLKVLGGLTGHLRPSAGVAAKNVVRDPRRASATATALMLAIGLVVTLQVGAASMQATINAQIAAAYPIDLWVRGTVDGAGQLSAVPNGVSSRLADVPGVSASVRLSCREITMGEGPTAKTRSLCRYDPSIAEVAPGQPSQLPDGAVLVPARSGFPKAGTRATMVGLDGAPVTGVAVTGKLAAQVGAVFVPPALYDAIGGPSTDGFVVLLRVADRDNIMPVMRAFDKAIGGDTSVFQGGALSQKYAYDKIMSILVSITTGLLAVAVLIALVGVSNTLTLSVIERQKESAILRALGFKRGQLRAMLLTEALLLTLVSALVGVAFGAFFGWLGTNALTVQIDGPNAASTGTIMAIDWGATLGLLGVLVAAAALASLLPGRRAAQASPVEALAQDVS